MKNITLFIGFLLACFLLNAQQLVLSVSVDNSAPKVGEMIEVIVKTTINGNIQITYPSEFIPGGGVMNGMSRQISNSGYSTIYYRSESGAFQKEGEFTIGPATIRKGNKSYTSNKVVVKVKNIPQATNSANPLMSKSLANKPAFGLIETNKSSVYVGEPVSITARVFAQFEPKKFEDYREYTSKGLPDKHKIPNPEITNVELKNFQNKRYYSFSYDKSISFPAQAGTFSIQPFQLTLGHFFDQERITSEPASITVKSLPSDAPVTFRGTVGKINVERSVIKNAEKQGDVATISITFSGYGNLHSIEIPDLKLPSSMQLYGDPKIEEDFQFTEKGAEGKLTIEYNIQILDPGNLMIPNFMFSYFDLETEKYIELALDSIFFNVERTPGFNRTKAKEDATLRLASKKINQEDEKQFLSPRKILVMGGIASAILALVFFVFKRSKKSKTNIQSEDDFSEKSQSNTTETLTEKQVELTVFEINLDSLATKINEPEEYINSVCLALDNWMESKLDQHEVKSLSRLEKISRLEAQLNSEDEIKIVRSIFAKIDEARYGLKIDSFGCQQIQLKLEDLLNNRTQVKN